jgi:hypothetical protein
MGRRVVSNKNPFTTLLRCSLGFRLNFSWLDILMYSVFFLFDLVFLLVASVLCLFSRKKVVPLMASYPSHAQYEIDDHSSALFFLSSLYCATKSLIIPKPSTLTVTSPSPVHHFASPPKLPWHVLVTLSVPYLRSNVLLVGCVYGFIMFACFFTSFFISMLFLVCFKIVLCV